MHTQTVPRARRWAVALVLSLLVVCHGALLYYVSVRAALSALVISGVVLLLVLTHLGRIRTLGAQLRRRLLRARSK